MKNAVSQLRILGLIEGVSYLALLGIAMPLKYFAGMPIAVKVTGWIHGVLFVGVCLCLLRVLMSTAWPFARAVVVFVAALLPFGPFVLDRRMKEWEREQVPA